MRQIKPENGKQLLTVLLMIYLIAIALFNNDMKIILALIIFVTISLVIKKTIFLKILSLFSLFLVPIFATLSNEKYIHLGYKLLFYSLAILTIYIIWETPSDEEL